MRTMSPAEYVRHVREREAESEGDALSSVRRIIEDVRANGDEALCRYSRSLDGVDLAPRDIEVTADEFEAAYRAVDGTTLEAIRTAIRSVEAYHTYAAGPAVRSLRAWFDGEVIDGTLMGRVSKPVRRAGLYVPGGRNPYVSTVVMTAVPARVAGVEEIIACTPPDKDGRVDPHILVAAREAGVHRLFRIGGAQAVAAMAWGTHSVPKADVVAGPGNRYVALAKRLVYGVVGIDSPAGPSEVAVIADDSADPGLISADMLAQVEHGPDSIAVLFSTSGRLMGEVSARLKQKEPRREAQMLSVLCRDLEEAVALANETAPEHLQIVVDEPLRAVAGVRCAGAILVGYYSPAAVGDYVAGPSHVLPTGGAARFASGLSVETFMTTSSLIWMGPNRYKKAADVAVTLAMVEGMPCHAESLMYRLQVGGSVGGE